MPYTQYHSTRSRSPLGPLSAAIIAGLAPDGGLWAPAVWPVITTEDLGSWQELDYGALATALVQRFAPDLAPSQLTAAIQAAYGTPGFAEAKIAPVTLLEPNTFQLELWHGPTSAFKDFGLQLLPRLFALASAKRVDNQARGKRNAHYHILTATSGDTGGAALAGFKGRPQTSVTVLYPEAGTSAVQAAQMLSYAGDNCQVLPIVGDFDVCQRLVKALFGNPEWQAELGSDGVFLSSANSINWGRILAQMVYFFHGYLTLVCRQRIGMGGRLSVAVPTGNFGNILSAFYAKQIGLPLGQLICATNANDVLAGFIQTGRYDIRQRRLKKTFSPSMDILMASNIERLLFALTEDTTATAKLMLSLQTNGFFELNKKVKASLQAHFCGESATDAETLAQIQATWEQTGQLLDPHTACAVHALKTSRAKATLNAVPTLVVSTAHWSKFPLATARAIFPDTIVNDDFAALDQVRDRVPQATVPDWLRRLDRTQKAGVIQSLTPDSQKIRQSITSWIHARLG